MLFILYNICGKSLILRSLRRFAQTFFKSLIEFLMLWIFHDALENLVFDADATRTVFRFMGV